MVKVKTPSNLKPYIYKCECGSLVKYNNPTSSYYLIRVPNGGIKNCKFCYKLSLLSIPELVGLK